MLNNRVVATSMVAAFKHNVQTSKSNIELFICIIVYITEFEAVIFPRFLVTGGRVCSMVAMFKHNDQTQMSNIDLPIYIIV